MRAFVPTASSTSGTGVSGILDALQSLNEQFALEGRALLRIGIAIHSGSTVVGSIGSPQRLEFTAVGSTVNLASRIEGLTKEFNVSLLLTAATCAGLRDRSRLIEFPPHQVRGFEKPVRLFGLTGAS